jgi:hypothetical protein
MQFQSKYWYPKNAPKALLQFERECISDPCLAFCKFLEDENGAIKSVIVNNGIGKLNQEEIIAKIVSLPNLKKFNWITLYGCGTLKAEGLKIIFESKTIRDVFLMGHDKLTPQWAGVCNTCLDRLLLNGCSVGEELLDSLRNFLEITTLRLVDVGLRYVDPARINEVPKLTLLILDSALAENFNRSKMRPGIELYVANGPEENNHLGCI